MYIRHLISIAMGLLAIFALPEVRADAVAEAQTTYQTQGAGSFDAQAGAQRWAEKFTEVDTGKQISFASCHGHDLRQSGQHSRTLKSIEPMSPVVNPQRLTDVKKIEKWFLRNCKGTWGRECTPQEKGDFLSYIQSQ